MAKRKVFEGLNVKAYGFPTIGFEQFRVQSEVQSNLDARINNVLKFAVGKVEEQSKIDAYEYAASNPLTISEYLNADPNERNKQVFIRVDCKRWIKWVHAYGGIYGSCTNSITPIWIY